jgi:tetratricopeptide (TPR) repeat protein
MDNILPLIYLLILLGSLSLVTVVIGKEVIKKRQMELQLATLQNKIRTKECEYKDYYNLGKIYLSKKLFDQAIIQFRYALKLWDLNDKEGLANLYNTVGFTYAETEQYEIAIYYYQEAIKYIKNYVAALNNLGFAYEKKQLISEAIKIYKEVIDYDSKNEIATSRLIVLSRRLRVSG